MSILKIYICSVILETDKLSTLKSNFKIILSMKRTAILFYTLLPLLLLIGSGQALARKQWTEKQAWKWQEEVGVIKGFNEPNPAYPSMTRSMCCAKPMKWV